MIRKEIENTGYKFMGTLKYADLYHKKAILYFMEVCGSEELTNIKNIEFAYYVNKNTGMHLYIWLDYISNKPIFILHNFGRRVKYISYFLTPEILKHVS